MTRYNGWTNWETWNVALWIDNDYGTYKAKIDALRRRIIAGPETCRQWVQNLLPDGTPDFGSTADYKAVNWVEIWDHWKEEGDA